jgi:hypothetical protein
MKKGEKFERIITAIERSLSSTGKIIRNYKVKDKDTGRSRQIDIAVIIKDTYRNIFCMIEVKDHKRQIDSPEIDKIIGIRNSVNANKAIMVSKSGFTKPALEKAKKNSIGTLTFEDIEKINWFEWIGFDFIRSFKWTIHSYKSVDIVLNVPQEKIESIPFNQPKFDDKIFFNIEKKRLSLSQIIRICLAQNHQLSDIMPEDNSIIPISLNIEISNDLFLNTKQGNYPVKSINVVIDLQLTRHKSPINVHIYRDIEKDEIIAQVITASVPLMKGKRKIALAVPGNGNIGGKKISINLLKLDDDKS